LYLRMSLLLTLAVLAGCGGGHQLPSKSGSAEVRTTGPESTNPAPATAVDVSNFNRPKLQLVGNGGKCNLGSGATFHFVGSGFTPHGKVLLLVFAPPSYKDPVYKNPDRLYWYQANFGVYHANSHGRFRTIGWDCTHGPGNKPDVQGKSEVKALDWKASVACSSAHFEVVP
jgi:hypothetical protein